MYQVRPATMADFDAVDRLLGRVYPRLLKEDYPPSVRVLVLPRISRAQPGLLGSGTYYVAEDEGGRIVGAGGWTPDRRASGLAHVRHLVTDDRLLRRGIARALVERSFAEARGAGAVRIEAQLTFTAEPFYAALGFMRRGIVEVPLDTGIVFPAVLMERAL